MMQRDMRYVHDTAVVLVLAASQQALTWMLRPGDAQASKQITRSTYGTVSNSFNPLFSECSGVIGLACGKLLPDRISQKGRFLRQVL